MGIWESCHRRRQPATRGGAVGIRPRWGFRGRHKQSANARANKQSIRPDGDFRGRATKHVEPGGAKDVGIRP